MVFGHMSEKQKRKLKLLIKLFNTFNTFLLSPLKIYNFKIFVYFKFPLNFMTYLLNAGVF